MRSKPSSVPALSWSKSLLLRLYGVGMLALIVVATLVGASIHFARITGKGAETLHQRGLVGVVHAAKPVSGLGPLVGGRSPVSRS